MRPAGGQGLEVYEKFFNLRERPFDLTPNPRFLYLTAKHREALGNLQYGITSRKAITVLVGEAGTGKTTLLRAALDSLASPTLRSVLVNNPTLTRPEFYELLAGRFGLSPQAAASKARFLFELEENVLAHRRAGGTTALVIDEAQSLPSELMEEVRLLANFETDTDKLLPVVLAGQPELAERLEREDLRQLKQRVVLRCELQPLDLRETAAYISGRILIAGGEGARLFTREAVQLIYERSGGVPRTISVICENALIGGFAAGMKPVDANLVLEVCRDFRLRQQAAGAADRSAEPLVVAAGRPQKAVGAAAPGGEAAATGAVDALPRRNPFTFFSDSSPENGNHSTPSRAAGGVMFGHFQEPKKRRKRFLFF